MAGRMPAISLCSAARERQVATAMKALYDFTSGKRGTVLKTPAGTTTRITIRIDDDLLQWFCKQVHRVPGARRISRSECGSLGRASRSDGNVACTLFDVGHQDRVNCSSPASA